MTDRRFRPPWMLDEHDECFIVRDASGQALGYFYFDEGATEPGHRQAAHARRCAAHGGEFCQVAGLYSVLLAEHPAPVLLVHFVGDAGPRQPHKVGERCIGST
jgi:hypothetical protein